MYNLQILDIVIIFLVFLWVYNLLLYPILLFVLSKFINRPIKTNPKFEPDLTVVIAAHNEENLIGGAIESIYASNYPIEKLSVIVASDGSTDNTIQILASLSKKFKSLTYLDLPRSGKNRTLDRAVEMVKTEFIYMMDADCRLSPDVLSNSMSMMADPKVGIVLSRIEHEENERKENTGKLGESAYHQYETFLRIKETQIHSAVNGIGVYAVRKNLLDPIASDRFCDDFHSLVCILTKKYRAVLSVNSIVREIRSKSVGLDINRRIRFVSGNLSTMSKYWRILMPDYGFTALFMFSHKVLRWFSPIILMLCLILIPFLSVHSPLRILLLSLEILFVSMCILGYFFEKNGIKVKILRLAFYFASMNYSYLLGIIRFLKGEQNSYWNVNYFEKIKKYN